MLSHVLGNLIFFSSSYKNCFHHPGIPSTELINENALSLTTNLLIVPLILLLTVPAGSVPGLILCTAKFLMNVNGAAHMQTWQKI